MPSKLVRDLKRGNVDADVLISASVQEVTRTNAALTRAAFQSLLSRGDPEVEIPFHGNTLDCIGRGDFIAMKVLSGGIWPRSPRSARVHSNLSAELSAQVHVVSKR